jgi:hypothetical protein
VQHHRLLPLSALPYYSHLTVDQRAKRRCCMPNCDAKTGYYCLTCSDVTNEQKPTLVCVCNPSNKAASTCLYDHRQQGR